MDMPQILESPWWVVEVEEEVSDLNHNEESKASRKLDRLLFQSKLHLIVYMGQNIKSLT